MFGFKDREQLQRWIAEAGMICIGVGALWTGGCAGSARDGLAAAGSTPAKASSEVASTDTSGHAALTDRRPAKAKRRPDRQTAARTRRAAPKKPAGDPFLAESPTVARRQARPAQDKTTPAAAASATQGAAGPGAVRIASRPPVAPPVTPAVKPPKATTTANARSAPAQTTVARTTPTPRPTSRTITQASAKMPADARRGKPPVITPANAPPAGTAVDTPVVTPSATDSPTGPEAEISTTTGFERQRADRLMERAQLMLSQNFEEEALRLASVAEQLEKSRQVAYLPGEERPSEFIARLQQGAAEDESESAPAPEVPQVAAASAEVRRNRSQPVPPGAKRSRVELTNISAGWQAAAGSEENASNTADQPPAAQSTDLADLNQIALRETTRKGESRLEADPGLGASTTAAAPAPPDAAVAHDSATVPAPATETKAEDAAELEPVVDAHAVPAQSPVNTTTVLGLLAGLAGLLGLAYWRRQERKHYASATR